LIVACFNYIEGSVFAVVNVGCISITSISHEGIRKQLQCCFIYQNLVLNRPYFKNKERIIAKEGTETSIGENN
jgi:hypothetical protein